MSTSDDFSRTASAWAPASLSNLGPGFDSLGIAISGLGDRVTARRTRGDSAVEIRGGAEKLPTDPRLNTASVAAMAVLEALGAAGGIRLRIEKSIPFGSGLGGSAACAAAGAVAANAVLGEPLTRSELVTAALAGEAVASGSVHGDNAIPALLGGVILVDSVGPERYRAICTSTDLFFSVVVPDLQVETSLARRMLPGEVPLDDAVCNASSLAWLVEAIRDGNVDIAGQMVMRDRIVEPVRAALIPCYQVVREAALGAGAPGFALSGSGPAMFALGRTRPEAERVTKDMARACASAGFECLALTTAVEQEGARVER